MSPKSHHKCPYKREEKGGNTDTQMSDVTTEAEKGVMKPQAWERWDDHQTLEEARNGFSPRAQWQFISRVIGILGNCYKGKV